MKSNGKLISYLAKTGELRTPFILQADVDLLGTDVGCGIILYVLFPCLLYHAQMLTPLLSAL